MVHKSNKPNAVKSFRKIKCYSSSNTRPIKNTCDSIRHNSQKICSWIWKSESISKITKMWTILEVVNKLFVYKFLKHITNHTKRTNIVVVFSRRPLPKIIISTGHRWYFSTIWKTIFFQVFIGKFRSFVWKFRFTVIQNYYWYTVKTKYLLGIKVG